MGMKLLEAKQKPQTDSSVVWPGPILQGPESCSWRLCRGYADGDTNVWWVMSNFQFCFVQLSYDKLCKNLFSPFIFWSIDTHVLLVLSHDHFLLVSHIASTKGWQAPTISIHPHSGLNHTFRHIDDFHIYVLPIFHKKTDISYIDNRLTDTHTHIYIHTYIYIRICIYIYVYWYTHDHHDPVPSLSIPKGRQDAELPRRAAALGAGVTWWEHFGETWDVTMKEMDIYYIAKHGGF